MKGGGNVKENTQGSGDGGCTDLYAGIDASDSWGVRGSGIFVYKR